MNLSKADFVARMQAGKDRAQAARNRGQSTGKAAKGWVRVTHATDEDGPTDEQRARAYGIASVEIAIEDMWRELHPERYEAFDNWLPPISSIERRPVKPGDGLVEWLNVALAA